MTHRRLLLCLQRARAGSLAYLGNVPERRALNRSLKRLVFSLMSAESPIKGLSRILKLTDSLPVRCDGTMTCSCDDCERDRQLRARRGVRHSPQPWHGKRAA